MSAGDRFHYVCSNGHIMTARYEMKKCCVMRNGVPCKGTLTQHKGRGGNRAR